MVPGPFPVSRKSQGFVGKYVSRYHEKDRHHCLTAPKQIDEWHLRDPDVAWSRAISMEDVFREVVREMLVHHNQASNASESVHCSNLMIGRCYCTKSWRPELMGDEGWQETYRSCSNEGQTLSAVI